MTIDRDLEHQIAEDQARERTRHAKCSVCRIMWVDVMAGEDTCPDCTDPTPWCHACGAMSKIQCDCGPLAPTR